MTENGIALLTSLYKRYSDVIKPLLAEIEAVYEKFPTSLYNEIRAINDHVARVFVYGDETQIDKARSHIIRATRDCYKCLNLYYKKEAERFDKSMRYLAPKTPGECKLMVDYSERLNAATSLVEIAKRKEYTEIDDIVCEAFQDAYIAYHALHDFIVSNGKVAFAMKAKHRMKAAASIALSVLTFALGCIITNNNAGILSALTSLFQRR